MSQQQPYANHVSFVHKPTNAISPHFALPARLFSMNRNIFILSTEGIAFAAPLRIMWALISAGSSQVARDYICSWSSLLWGFRRQVGERGSVAMGKSLENRMWKVHESTGRWWMFGKYQEVYRVQHSIQPPSMGSRRLVECLGYKGLGEGRNHKLLG